MPDFSPLHSHVVFRAFQVNCQYPDPTVKSYSLVLPVCTLINPIFFPQGKGPKDFLAGSHNQRVYGAQFSAHDSTGPYTVSLLKPIYIISLMRPYTEPQLQASALKLLFATFSLENSLIVKFTTRKPHGWEHS